MSAEVVQLHPPRSVAAQLWEAAPPLMRTRSSVSAVEKAVKAVLKDAGGPDALLAAFKRYLEEDPDLKAHREGKNHAGPQGLHRWLNGRHGRKWECWLEPVEPETPENTDPVRAALVASLGEGFVKSYVDPYEIRDGVLIVPENKLTARARLLENRDKLRAAGLVSMRKPDA
jgi:hypothetical protein